jgi:rhodanese-related sulfurtransferase
MRVRHTTLLLAVLAALAATPMVIPSVALAADATALQPKEGWYRALADFDFVRERVDIPPKPGVMVIDSRPAARQFDPGHIPGAINIPDSQFEKMVDRLPADKATQLIFYCGGLECMLSHTSAFKAEKLGYTQIRVYAAGMPEWQARGAQVSVSAAYLKKLMEDKAPYALIDARPKRLADKARKLGYRTVLTYPEGYPEWERLAGGANAATGATGAPAAKAVALVPGKEKGSVTVASFQQVWRDNPTSLMLVDVRDAKEFAAGTIKGAVNVTINELEKKLATLPTDRPVVFICGSGARSGEAYDTVKLHRPEVQAWFIDADIKFSAEGGYAMVQK